MKKTRKFVYRPRSPEVIMRRANQGRYPTLEERHKQAAEAEADFNRMVMEAARRKVPQGRT